MARRGGMAGGAAVGMRQHQRRPAAVHERRLGQQRLIGAAGLRVRLADDHQVGGARVAPEQARQAIDRAGLAPRGEADPTPIGQLARCGEHRLGLGLGMRQMLAEHLGRRVQPGHAAQERLGEQVERGDLGAAGGRQRQRHLKAPWRGGRVVEVDEKVLDHARRLLVAGPSGRWLGASALTPAPRRSRPRR
jgi:hypothetical protein